MGLLSRQFSESKLNSPMRLTRHIVPAALLAINLSGPAIAPFIAPPFRLNNRSGQTINEAYVHSPDVSVWEQGRLGVDVLRTRLTLSISLLNGRRINDTKLVSQAADRRSEWRVHSFSVFKSGASTRVLPNYLNLLARVQQRWLLSRSILYVSL